MKNQLAMINAEVIRKAETPQAASAPEARKQPIHDNEWCGQIDEVPKASESQNGSGTVTVATYLRKLIEQRDAARAQLAQYKNLEGQGWFHPDIVNDLRAQHNAARAHAAKLAEALELAIDWHRHGKTVMTKLEVQQALEEALAAWEAAQ